jgi:hypothetical protein
MMAVLCALVVGCPIGTNLGLLHLLWMLVSGRLLASRGAIIPGLSACGLSERAVRRAWMALGQGDWAGAGLLARWEQQVRAEGRWQPHVQGGYRPVAVDVTGFWRPRLQGCPTTHYHGVAGRALPAIPVGIVARVGSVGAQRLALPVAFVRPDAADPAPAAHERCLIAAAVQHCAAAEVLVFDSGFGLRAIQEAGATRFVVRVPQNSVFRRATPKPYGGRGPRPTLGEAVRPLARTFKGRVIPATEPDRRATWQDGRRVLRAEVWDDLVLVDAVERAAPCQVLAIYDPRYPDPLLLATPLPFTAQAAQACYRDRWPVEQLPLVAKQLLGAARQFVHEAETRQRLPELALLAASVLAYVAATAPAVPTGFWDRRPQPTAGRLRRALAACPFPQTLPLPARIRPKAARTDHLPTGFWHQRPQAPTTPPARDVQIAA